MSLLPKQNPSSMAEHSTLQATSPTFWDGFLETFKGIFSDKGVLLLLMIAPIIYGFFILGHIRPR